MKPKVMVFASLFGPADSAQSCLPFSSLLVTLSFSMIYTWAPQPDKASRSTAFRSACEIVSNS
jgi:hypothetical protein